MCHGMFREGASRVLFKGVSTFVLMFSKDVKGCLCLQEFHVRFCCTKTSNEEIGNWDSGKIE